MPLTFPGPTEPKFDVAKTAVQSPGSPLTGNASQTESPGAGPLGISPAGPRETGGSVLPLTPDSSFRNPGMAMFSSTSGPASVLARFLDGDSARNLRRVNQAFRANVARDPILRVRSRVARHVADVQKEEARCRQDDSWLSFGKSLATGGLHPIIRDWRRDKKDRAADEDSRSAAERVRNYRDNKAAWRADIRHLIDAGDLPAFNAPLETCDKYLSKASGADLEITAEDREQLQRYFPVHTAEPWPATDREFVARARNHILSNALRALEAGSSEPRPRLFFDLGPYEQLDLNQLEPARLRGLTRLNMDEPD